MSQSPSSRGPNFPNTPGGLIRGIAITEDWLRDVRCAHRDHTSTGLRTGRLVGVDIDLENEGHTNIILDKVQQPLGPSYFRRFGSKGMMLCYRNETPIKKIIIKGRRRLKGKVETLVEVLGEGQQFVAYGYHPNGNAYTWPNAEFDPFSTPLDQMPETTPDRIRSMVTAEAKKLRDLGYCDVHVNESGVADESDLTKGAAMRGGFVTLSSGARGSGWKP